MIKVLMLISICCSNLLCYGQKQLTIPCSCVEVVRVPLKNGEIVYATINSKKQGYSVLYDSLGRRNIETCYIDGEETGPITIYYPEGTVNVSGYLIAGRQNGLEISYYPNGNIESKTMYKMGNRDGIREEYTENGTLDKRYLFQCDTLVDILLNNKILPMPPGFDKYNKTGY